MVTVDIDDVLSDEVDNILEMNSIKSSYPNKRFYINQAIREKNQKIRLEYQLIKK